MRTRTRQRSGSVTILVTLSLFTMCGLLGLAVDMGWSSYVRKSAQAAADAAAMAAVKEAMARYGHGGTWTCSDELTCQPPTNCPATPVSPPVTVGDNACLYAQRNGFTQNGGNGRQSVSVAAGTTSPPPTAPGVNVYYWVTVRTSEAVPQLFSAVMGNFWATPSARATAALVDSPINPSLCLLNRKLDYSPWGQGVDMAAGGGGGGANNALGGNVIGGNGIILASSADGTASSNYHYAGEIQGSTGVVAPFTYVRGAGTVDDPHGQWNARPTNGFRDRPFFQDPMRDKGQPPPPTGLASCPVLNGVIKGGTGWVGPGNYYAVDSAGNATGAKIAFTGDIKFTTGGSCVNSSTGVTGFGNYVFFGGMDFSAPQLARVTFTPGRYILAGVKSNGSQADQIMAFRNGIELTDQTPTVGGDAAPNSDAGEIFVLTDANYPGLVVPAAVESVRSRLQQGVIDQQAGNNDQTIINLHGLNNDKSSGGYGNVPENLSDFRMVFLWQDQRNSRIAYDNTGNIDLRACAIGEDGVHAPSLDNPCLRTLDHSDSPAMKLQASVNSHYYGAIYQPRGAWMDLGGSNGIISPLMLVTGSISISGGNTIWLKPLPNALPMHMVALVE